MVAQASVLYASALKQSFESLPFAWGEIPRGALTEIAGPPSSGRSAFLCSLLAAASAKQEFCALIDAHNAFDPASAARAGVLLSRILWVRCGGNAEHALKAADWLAQGGGLGLVALDLGDTPVKIAHRIPLAAWFRLRQAVENTRTALVSLAQRVHAPSCSALKIELSRTRTIWRGMGPGRLLQGFAVTAAHVKNHRRQEVVVTLHR
jgi:recombination protein RecA